MCSDALGAAHLCCCLQAADAGQQSLLLQGAVRQLPLCGLQMAGQLDETACSCLPSADEVLHHSSTVGRHLDHSALRKSTCSQTVAQTVR